MRDIMAEVYQGQSQFEEVAVYIRDNLEIHSNSIKTFILVMRVALHAQRFKDIGKTGLKAEERKEKLDTRIPGDFIG
jgi:hypothetical protein